MSSGNKKKKVIKSNKDNKKEVINAKENVDKVLDDKKDDKKEVINAKENVDKVQDDKKNDKVQDSKKTEKESKKSKKLEKDNKDNSPAKKESKSKSKEIDESKAINKYKNVPLGDLYNELGGMKNYIEILEERKKELLQAKAILDSRKRNEAIKKSTENTYDLKFKYQEATFRRHTVPTSVNLEIVKNADVDNSRPVDTIQQNNRVMQNSEARSTVNQPFQRPPQQANQQIFRRDPPKPAEVKVNGVMERSELRRVDANNAPAPNQANNPNLHQQQKISPFGPAPLPQQQAMMANQQNVLPQQQQQNVNFPTAGIAPNLPGKKIDVKPLYDQIHKIILNKSSVKGIYVTMIVLGVFLILCVMFLILWGFAVNWDFTSPDGFFNFTFNNVQTKFLELFGKLFSISAWK